MAAGPFRNRSFAHRFTKLGDEAEAVFEAVYPEGYVRYGLNRPPIYLAWVPPFIRYSPDYLTAKGLVEVQGFGRDRTLKCKTDKLDALLEWHRIFRADLFVWNSKDQQYAWVRIPDLWTAVCDGAAEERTFDEGKPYWALRSESIPTTDAGWRAYSHATE